MEDNGFIKYVCKEKTKELLDTVHTLYSNKFTNTNKESELLIITDLIDLMKIDNNVLIKKIEKKKQKFILRKNRKPKKKFTYSNLERCQARTWGPVCKKGDTIKYGFQCCKKKQQGSEYCFIHQKKLTHGNYFKEPDQIIKDHFKKGNKK